MAELMSAVVSDDELYRYELTRVWDKLKPMALWVMLNPSTADAERDDPTIRRVRGFTQREGLGGFVVVNLFALRVTRPAHLAHHPDPVGPENDEYILRHLHNLKNDKIIGAWGAYGKYMDRAEWFMTNLLPDWRQINCLGRTAGFQPSHPLYIRADTPLFPYE